MKKKVNTVMSVLTGGITGALAGSMVIGTKMRKKIDMQQKDFSKIASYYHLFNQWLTIRQQGRTLAEYFEQKNYKTIAIYGMKEFGDRLYDELKDSDIEVKYAIDRNADRIYADVDIITPDDNLEPVDVIVVTATYFFDEIEGQLSEIVDYPIVSLEDILYEM